MEQIVAAIVSTNTQSEHELKQLRHTLAKNHAIILASAHQIDAALSAIDPRVNTLGYVYLLSVKAAGGHIDLSSFVPQAKRVLLGSAIQIRIAASQFVDVFKAYAKIMIRNQRAIRCIRPLQQAIRMLQPAADHLTPLHPLLLQAALLSRCYYVGAELLADEITEIRPLDTSLTVTDFLLYCYYGGMVFIGLKRYHDAMRLLQLAITAPALSLSAIIIEAYKKFALVALIADGKVPQLPKYTSGVVNRGIKVIIPAPYHEFITAYGTNSIDDLHTIANKFAEVFQSDRNFGLVLQCIKSLHYRNIQRNTQVYLTLSLTDIKESGKLESEKEAEKAIVHMIESGTLSASISQAQGIVSFETDHEQYNTPAMAAQLDQHIRTAISLNNKVKQLDESILTSAEYIQHTIMRDASDFRAGGFGDFDEMQADSVGFFDRVGLMR